MTAKDTQPSLHATDRLLSHHLATRPVSTPLINSLQQKTTRPTVHRRPTVPVRRHLAAQRVQSVHAVPVRRDLP
jgi:hypothetical protein